MPGMSALQLPPSSSAVDSRATMSESPVEDKLQAKTQHGNTMQNDDARLKLIWDSIMVDVGKKTVYRTVSVLLISWDDDAGDLKTGQEVKDLRHVLETKYHFEVTDKRLTRGAKAQVQINQHLANFVAEKDNDGEDGLIIVYYAGHGVPGNPGELTLAGTRKPEHHDSEKTKSLNEIVWHHAEILIKCSSRDVLVIFDCCAAGNLGRDIGRSAHFGRRAFEYLGATTADQSTQPPGPDSFTSGLIWALEKLAVSRGPFITSELLRKIHEAPNFPKDQWPVYHDRDQPSLRKIVIAPLLEDDPQQATKSTKEPGGQPECTEYLDLRVSLSKHPNEDEIEAFSHALKDLIVTKSIPALRVSWGKLSSIEGPPIRFFDIARSITTVKRSFRKRSRNKSMTQNGLSDAKEELNRRPEFSSDAASVKGDPDKSPRKRPRV